MRIRTAIAVAALLPASLAFTATADGGQAEGGTGDDAGVVIEPEPVASAVGLSVSGQYSCALLVDGDVRCWGDGLHDERPPHYRGGDAVDLAAGSRHLCVLTEDGDVRCMGRDDDGQAEDYTERDVVELAVGGVNTCVLRTDGDVTCWGSDARGVTDGYQGGDAVSLDVGGGHACVLVNDGSVECWGWDFHGQTDGYAGDDAVAVTANGYVSCALLATGDVDCWGFFPLGYDGGDAVDVATGGIDHACALTVAGDVVCWGSNGNDKSNGHAGGDATGLDAASYKTCVLTQQDVVLCEGFNQFGDADDFVPVSAVRDVQVDHDGEKLQIAGSAHYGDLWEVVVGTDGVDGLDGLAAELGYEIRQARIGQAAVGSEDLELTLRVADLEQVAELRDGVRFGWDFAVARPDGEQSTFRVEGVVATVTESPQRYRTQFSLHGDCKPSPTGADCAVDLGRLAAEAKTDIDELAIRVPADALRDVAGDLSGAHFLPADVDGGITAVPAGPVDSVVGTDHGFRLEQDHGYALPTRSVELTLVDQTGAATSTSAALDATAFDATFDVDEGTADILLIDVCFGLNCDRTTVPLG